MRDELQHVNSQYNTFNSLQPLRVNLTDMNRRCKYPSTKSHNLKRMSLFINKFKYYDTLKMNLSGSNDTILLKFV